MHHTRADNCFYRRKTALSLYLSILLSLLNKIHIQEQENKKGQTNVAGGDWVLNIFNILRPLVLYLKIKPNHVSHEYVI